MQVSEVMHRGITSANINDSIKHVAELMRQKDIGAIPILENNKPVGFVTDRDIVISCVAEGYSPEKPISHAMSEDIICVTEDQNVADVTSLMEDNQISRILVVDNENRPIGMVSLKDLLAKNDESENVEVISRIKQ
jgi:CBS domain-containing protein